MARHEHSARAESGQGCGMKILLGAMGALVHDNKILLLKRIKPPYAGLWSLPGGKLDFGEHIEECAVREFKEETGIDVDSIGIRGILSEFLYHEGEKDGHFLMFICNLKAKGSVNFKRSEDGELAWFDIDSIEKRKDEIVGSDIEMIKQMVLGKGDDLKIHKSIMKKKDDRYILESFGAD